MSIHRVKRHLSHENSWYVYKCQYALIFIIVLLGIGTVTESDEGNNKVFEGVNVLCEGGKKIYLFIITNLHISKG